MLVRLSSALFKPSGFLLPDDADADYSKVQKLREHAQWTVHAVGQS